MNRLDILKNIADNKNEDKKALLLTVVDYKGENGDKNLLGEKIYITEKRGPLASEGIEPLLAEIMDNLPASEELLDRVQPELFQIELAGKRLELYMEAIIDKPRLLIFGGGHVSKPLARIGSMSGFEVNVIDDRPDLLTADRFPTADNLICEEFALYLAREKIGSEDYLVIVTRGHQHDYTVLKRVINSPARYIGMIGSNRKVNLTFERLREKEGTSDELLNRVNAPVGLDIGSETPAGIAVSIISEIIAVRRGKK
ncbi:MAG: XdhC family protein [Bacillota bacterium]